MGQHISDEADLLNRKIAEVKNGLLSSGLSSLGSFVVGGVITSISYSMTTPGGTYLATSGLFLVGLISGVIACWRLVQLLFLLAKRVARREDILARSYEAPIDRSWKDLD